MIRSASSVLVIGCALAACSVRSSVPLAADASGSGSGSGSGLDACPTTFSACGGDLTGTWVLAEICGTSTEAAACSTAIESDTFTGDEMMTFSGTMLTSQKMDTIVTTVDASSCLGSGTTCDTIAAKLPAYSCAPPMSGGCTCTATNPFDVTATYTYSTSDGTLTYAPSSGSGASFAVEYCVGGDRLYLAIPELSTIVQSYVRAEEHLR